MDYQIITFYEFRKIADPERIRTQLRKLMAEHSIYGTIIIAEEGYNATVCGKPDDVREFVRLAGETLGADLRLRSSFHRDRPFRRQKVKLKKEIVTLRKRVDISKGTGTHVGPARWNELLNDPETLVLDTRNDYEHRVGTFRNALNPRTGSFNELPEFVEKNLDPARHKRIAMFCTGGIRCEKFAPYLKEKGFDEVYQLEGGILRYLEEVPEEESLWRGECFVFDERITVDHELKQGTEPDLSLDTER